ncbi:hypothetical protein IWQ49_006039 [Labrenzia sp. EL_126]|nr:hypothetical protein [Labrenzia sp. EL_126]
MKGHQAFNPADLGILPHYNHARQIRIRRLILEDWKEAEVKLPTYMKQVARAISHTGVPEEWLAKLSHQTMAKMLSDTSTPRHEFWGCLHLYLSIRFANAHVLETALYDLERLGTALAGFLSLKDLDLTGFGARALKTPTNLTLKVFEASDPAYSHVFGVRPVIQDDPLKPHTNTFFSGPAVVFADRLIATLRDPAMTDIEVLDLQINELTPQADTTIIRRLDAFAEVYQR